MFFRKLDFHFWVGLHQATLVSGARGEPPRCHTALVYLTCMMFDIIDTHTTTVGIISVMTNLLLFNPH